MQYTTKEVAEEVGRAVATVRNTIKKLNVPTTKEGRSILIDEDGLAILVDHFQSLDKKYYNSEWLNDYNNYIYGNGLIYKILDIFYKYLKIQYEKHRSWY